MAGYRHHRDDRVGCSRLGGLAIEGRRTDGRSRAPAAGRTGSPADDRHDCHLPRVDCHEHSQAATAAPPSRGRHRGRAHPVPTNRAGISVRPEGDLAVTVYNAAGAPVAWGGRPSDLPPLACSRPADRFGSAVRRSRTTGSAAGLSRTHRRQRGGRDGAIAARHRRGRTGHLADARCRCGRIGQLRAANLDRAGCASHPLRRGRRLVCARTAFPFTRRPASCCSKRTFLRTNFSNSRGLPPGSLRPRAGDAAVTVLLLVGPLLDARARSHPPQAT